MRTEATPERVAKLPAWARDERTRLRRRISALEGEVAALRAEPGALDRNPSDIHVATLDPYGTKVPVGAGHVAWAFPNENNDRRVKRLSARFVAATQYERAHINVNASYGALHIRPRAGNDIRLELHDD